RVRSGSITLDGRDLLAVRGEALQRIWRDDVRLVPQEPLTALNPSLRIGPQIAETLPSGLDSREQQARIVSLLRRVRIADPERIAVLYVSHSLGVVARLCDRVAVLYAGELVEDAPVRELFAKPLHPYTQALLDSMPLLGQHKAQSPLRATAGQIPPLDALPPGCVFAPRCPLATDLTHRERPALEAPSESRRVRCHRWREIAAAEVSAHQPLSAPQPAPTAALSAANVVLDVRDLSKSFDVSRPLLDSLRNAPPPALRALSGVS